MKYLASYLLLTLGGKTSPSASDIKELLDSVGIEAEEERLNKLISELEGKDVSQVGIFVVGKGMCNRLTLILYVNSSSSKDRRS